MNEKEALLVISDMIGKTKEDIKDNGFFYMFWGWLVLIASLSCYYIITFTSFEYNGLPWAILMPLGGLISGIAGARRSKRETVKTYVGESMKHALIAFVVAMMLAIFGMSYNNNSWAAFYPTIMLLYGIWLYVSGGLLKFRPLVWGGVLNWATALAGYLYPDTQAHLLLIALGVMGGFIIPGYLLKKRAATDVQGA